MVVLANSDLQGGGLHFPHLHTTFDYSSMAVGTVLAWANVDVHGRPLECAVHEPGAVVAGRKVLFQTWARVG